MTVNKCGTIFCIIFYINFSKFNYYGWPTDSTSRHCKSGRVRPINSFSINATIFIVLFNSSKQSIFVTVSAFCNNFRYPVNFLVLTVPDLRNKISRKTMHNYFRHWYLGKERGSRCAYCTVVGRESNSHFKLLLSDMHLSVMLCLMFMRWRLDFSVLSNVNSYTLPLPNTF